MLDDDEGQMYASEGFLPDFMPLTPALVLIISSHHA